MGGCQLCKKTTEVMNEISDKIGLRRFLARIFISNSGVSSRRVSGFMTLIATLFLVFFGFDLEYCRIMAMLCISFFGLTTISSFGKPSAEDNNDVNIDNKG